MSGMTVKSFEPIVDDRTKVLILGTMPSQISLAQGQYYANPRNAFWRIIHGLFGSHPEAGYAERTAFLLDRRIGLWDVLASCRREGSSDASIRDPVPNDFPRLFARYPAIEAVFFNGGTAEALFRRFVLDKVPLKDGLVFQRLPSTSPAHAIPFEKKLEAWKVIVNVINR
jgi:TDG/mug DNA glycosylase family protein